MRYTKFEIKNFKGISDLTLDLTKNPTGNVIPLVGLNESGKTTILEAINCFQQEIEEDERHKLIHKRDKGGFTGDIAVRATLEFDQSDQDYIKGFISNISYKLESPVKSVTIAKKYIFKDDSFGEYTSTYLFVLKNEKHGLQVKTSKQKK